MERLIKNYVTTIMAILIVVYCGLMMYNGSEWSELVGFWGLALMLFRTKDSIINLPKE